MRDKTHGEFIERWASFVRNNPPEKWQIILDEFIDAQYDIHQRFLERIRNTKEGREKIIKLYSIKNLNGYKKLLN